MDESEAAQTGGEGVLLFVRVKSVSITRIFLSLLSELFTCPAVWLNKLGRGGTVGDFCTLLYAQGCSPPTPSLFKRAVVGQPCTDFNGTGHFPLGEMFCCSNTVQEKIKSQLRGFSSLGLTDLTRVWKLNRVTHGWRRQSV